MTTRTKSSSSRPTTSVEAGLLARLGLPKTASTQDVETAHDALISYLEAAPSELRSWSRVEIDRIDEAYALLSDPTIDRSALVSPSTGAPVEPAVTAAAVAVPPSATVARPAGTRRTVRRLGLAAAVLGGAAIVVVAVFNMGGGGSGVPGVNGSPAPEAAASPAIDTARVGSLMQKIQADPKDVVSLQALADIYFAANDYDSASGFLEKVLTVDAKNVTARLALGAARFNLGKPAEAETQWRQVLATDPNNLEAHYDLGFMYLSQSPADVANAKAEWTKVIAIDPNSDVAKSIQQHLASLDAMASPGASGAAGAAASPNSSAGPAGTPSPAGSPAPAVSPAVSPAASPAGN